MEKAKKMKSSLKGQATAEYLILVVILAIVLIPTLIRLGRTTEKSFQKVKRSSETRGWKRKARASRFLSPTQAHRKNLSPRAMPKWKDKRVPMKTIWNLRYDPKKSGRVESSYEPARRP